MTVQSDPNWDRWIFASMSKAFLTAFTTPNYTEPIDLFIEGMYRDRPQELELLEFRMDGPDQRQPHVGQFILDVDINILIRVMMNNVDFHRMRKLTGAVKRWLAQDHCIYRYGDGVADDDSLLGTLVLNNRSPLNKVRTNYFGQIDPKFQMEEATVEGSFSMYLR